jgi:hypothetical protein
VAAQVWDDADVTQVARGDSYPDLEYGESIERSPFLARLMSRGPQEPISERYSVNTLTLVCAAGAFVLVLVAEFHPWLKLSNVPGTGPDTGVSFDSSTLTLQRLGGVGSFAYYLGWMAIFALLGLAAVTDRRHRRVVVGVGSGLVAGVVFLIVGLLGQTNIMLAATGEAASGAHVQIQPGFLLGLGAALLAFAGFLLTALAGPRRGRWRRRPAEAEPSAAMELTVTPAGSVPELR